jgi:hypothetical protein
MKLPNVYKITIGSGFWSCEILGERKSAINKAVRKYLQETDLPRDLDGASIGFSVNCERIR